ncbi:glycosyltransferase family 2 protein [Alphaproteobacteria bacterium]|nr:glycosyltransferase family 2 protein [Alphaproteobacteria bacterium]
MPTPLREDWNNKISVILPNRNYEKYLEDAFNAIAEQEAQIKEVLIFDDASTDGSANIILNFRLTEANLVVTYFKEPKGIEFILNEGLRRATGEYVYFASSDDFIEKNFFRSALKQIRKVKDFGVLCGWSRLISANKEPMGIRPVLSPVNRSSFICGNGLAKSFEASDNFLIGNCCIYDRKKLTAIGGFKTEVGSFTDGIAMRALAINFGAIICHEVFVNVRLHDYNFSKFKFENKLQITEFHKKVVAADRALSALIAADDRGYSFPFSNRSIFFTVRNGIKSGDVTSNTLNLIVEESTNYFKNIGSSPLLNLGLKSKPMLLLHAFLVYRPYKVRDFVYGVLKMMIIRFFN